MVQTRRKSEGGYISIPRFTKDKNMRSKLYRLIREHRLKEGKDYKVIVKQTKIILIRKSIKVAAQKAP